MHTTTTINNHVSVLSELILGTRATLWSGKEIDLDGGINRFLNAARQATDAGGTLRFIGNGGSAAIASHCAIDFSKNGGMRASAFNDPAALTCLGNDYGYEQVFAKQIEFHARPEDLIVTISSSGRSRNILLAVEAARARTCKIITLSGFAPDNPLRSAGDVNFYIGSPEYGMVEVGHFALCHAMLDLHMASRSRAKVKSQKQLTYTIPSL